METKKCKQCGKVLPFSSFQKYNSRKKEGSTRNTKVGHDTTCIECNKLNALLTRIDKKENKTKDDLLALEKGEKYYKALVAKGLSPRGAYARRVLGDGTPRERVSDQLLSVMDAVLDEEGTVKAALQSFLEAAPTWSEKPEVYDEELEKIVAGVLKPNGKVLDIYKELHDQCLDKQAEYEDEYYGNGR